MKLEELTIPINLQTVGCEDPTFVAWAESGLVWLHERGMGWLRVTEAPYDAAYFAKYEEYAATPMGQAITAARAALVRRHAAGATACDVGIGCGAFIEATGGYGYDINPEGVAWLQARGLFLDPRQVPVDAITFWDAIEHLPDAAAFVASAREWVFCSLPIVPGDGPPRTDWKHFRRDEHCWYWTRAGFIAWMREQGFECVEHSTVESLLGREDAHTFAFRRAV